MHPFLILTYSSICRLTVATLHCADCIALLLKNGADARCPDHDDNTPMDLARDDAVVQLLQKSLRHLDLSAEKRGNVPHADSAA